MRTLKLFIILSLQFCCFNLTAGNLGFEYDIGTFRNDDTSAFVEFYYSFLQKDLKLVKNTEGLEIIGVIDIDLSDSNGKTLISETYRTPLLITDTANYNWNTRLMGQINFLLKKGEYRLSIKAYDFHDSANSFLAADKFIVEDYAGKIRASSLQLASEIKKSSNANDIFYKNSLEVVPNPSRLFGKNFTEVFYYIEFYNMLPGNITDKYSILKKITDSDNNVVKAGNNVYQLKNESKVEYGHFNISDMKTGNYNLEIVMFDSDSNKIAEQKNKFWIYNDLDTTVVDFETNNDGYLSSEYKEYTNEQVNNEINYISYIINDKFKQQIEDTKDLETKRKLLYNFWAKYDPNKSTTKNEFKVLYFDRIKYANKNFSSSFIEGWRTDRGRIYAIYGAPSDVERYPFESDTRAYEVWKYDNLQGGAEFVFIDFTSNGDDFRLVHSTMMNEIRDDQWRNKLRVIK